MPRGDGTGPTGQGPGTGRGLGRGDGRGRIEGSSMGPGGKCVCPSCNTEVKHMTGFPCSEIKCPKCGISMVRS